MSLGLGIIQEGLSVREGDRFLGTPREGSSPPGSQGPRGPPGAHARTVGVVGHGEQHQEGREGFGQAVEVLLSLLVLPVAVLL